MTLELQTRSWGYEKPFLSHSDFSWWHTYLCLWPRTPFYPMSQCVAMPVFSSPQPWTAWPWDLLVLSPTCGVGWCPRLGSAHPHPHGGAWCPRLEPPLMTLPQRGSALAAHWEHCCIQHWSLRIRDLLQIVHTDDFCSLSGPSLGTTAINAFANTSLQDYSHSRAMCPFVWHVTNFLKIAPLRINEQIYLQNIENAKENMTSKIQGTEPHQISSSWK